MIGGPGHEKLTAFLKRWPQQLAAKPKQILVISGHWEVSRKGRRRGEGGGGDNPAASVAAAAAAS